MNMKLQNFRTITFLVASLVFSLLIFASFFAAYAEGEGTLGNGIIGIALAKMFYVLRFPADPLLTGFSIDGWTIPIIGLVINALFFGFLTERVISILRNVTIRRGKTTA